MKRFLCLLLIIGLLTAGTTVGAEEYKRALLPENVAFSSGVTVGTENIYAGSRKAYFGFADVDMTGIRSVSVMYTNSMADSGSGETLAIVLDDPYAGTTVGYLFAGKQGGWVNETDITETSGTHDLYFVYLQGKVGLSVYVVKLFETATGKDPSKDRVPDSAIKDVFSDTWAATDDMGRKVADYEETGPVKTDGREALMFYWDWRSRATNVPAVIIPEIHRRHPSERDSYSSAVWPAQAVYFWNEPVLGFYDSSDYWVYRKHTEMLSAAGVDAILFDYSNVGYTYIPMLNILTEAFRDAKRSGVDVPKISIVGSLGANSDNNMRELISMYMNCFIDNDYSDIWYYLDGKPMVYDFSPTNAAKKGDVNAVETEILNTIENFFTFRNNGGRNGTPGKDQWMWLENFPQILRNIDPGTGRPEYVAVGVAINQSTIIQLAMTGVFSDEYAKGRGYSEVFGEDRTENGSNMAYFFREQAALALSAEPKIVFFDGWNEWNAGRQALYSGFSNAFVDLCDEENSRDFEPSKGILKDNYYNLLVDFIRKFKGVRKTPVASGAKTIDVTGAVSQWQEVGPEFLNNSQNYERNNTYGYRTYDYDTMKAGEELLYKTRVYNALASAKVSYDGDNLYFLAEAENAITTDTPDAMVLYVNADRNRATGWEGYDYAVNLNGMGTISKNVGDFWQWSNIGTASYSVKETALQLAIPRTIINETDAVDLEFKWTDGIPASGDILTFYREGSSAPMGRFNYVYTTKEQHHLGEDAILGDGAKTLLSDTAILKEGVNKMSVKSSIETFYEPDTRVTPVMRDGTLYIPEDALHEILDYGTSKSIYDGATDTFTLSKFTMERSGYTYEVTGKTTLVTTLGALSAYRDGSLITLSHPVTVIDGLISVPVSLLSDVFGYSVTSRKVGKRTIVVIDKDGAAPDGATVDTVLTYLE